LLFVGLYPKVKNVAHEVEIHSAPIVYECNMYVNSSLIICGHAVAVEQIITSRRQVDVKE